MRTNSAAVIRKVQQLNRLESTSFTIEKVIDWYFNYLAFRHGLIGEMPDVGRAVLALNSERQSA